MLTISPLLLPIRALIRCAFPHNIQSLDYFALLTILEPQLSHHHLAIVIASLNYQDYSQALQDISQVKSHPLNNPELLQSVQSLLDACGYQNWLEQD